MRKASVGIILALLVVASVGVGYLAVNPGRQPSTSISSQQTSVSTSSVKTATASATATSTTSPSGLELRIALNTTTIEAGRTLGANVTLFNTLNHNLPLLARAPANSTNSVEDWANYDFICANGGPVSYLAGFAIFRGRFSAENLSQAPSPLQVAAQAELPCVSLLLSQDATITFMPNSDSATIPGTGLSREPASLNVTTEACIAFSQCHRGTGLYGYWSTSSPICCPANSTVPKLFRYFTPGEYTLAAEDIWGQKVCAYFQVAQGPSPATAVSAQESPFSSQSSPVIGITLVNLGDVPISSIGAVLRFVPAPNGSASSTSYPFAFVVNSTDPLLPGQTVQDVRTLQGDLFDIGVSYPLTISGTLANGLNFTYTQQVQFVDTVPSW
jgi:hypothetical protein